MLSVGGQVSDVGKSMMWAKFVNILVFNIWCYTVSI